MKINCKRGHNFSDSNTYIDPSGERHCIACREITRKKFWKTHSDYLKNYRLRPGVRAAYLNSQRKMKLTVLTHYSPNQVLCCSWPGCFVDDLDELTIDHVNNDGATHREKNNRISGTSLHLWLKRYNYPTGFQTLCANHQLKKEIVRKREHFDVLYLERIACAGA
jgi:hypothetical protein